MSKLLTNNKAGRTHGFGLKVDTYGLSEFIWKEYLAGTSYGQIAKKCNDVLTARTDGRTYQIVSLNNIWAFCVKTRKELEISHGAQLQERMKEATDVVKKCAETVVRIDNMLDSINDDVRNAKEFACVIQQMHDMLELLANIQGKLQPSITIQMYNQNILQIVEAIKTDISLTPEDKKKVITLIADKIMPDAEDGDE